jgi:hypothetical protein
MNHVATSTETLLGYGHPDYARTLDGYGQPLALGHCEGWVIVRAIPCSSARDAMGPYPLFQCRHWHALPRDLEDLRASGLVSLLLVTDPLLTERERHVFGHFDVAKPFKAHYVTALDKPPELTVSRHHRSCSRRAARHLEIDIPSEPLDYLDEWCGLYELLIARHGIRDLRACSREGFRRLLTLPGVILLRAVREGRAVGAQIVIVQGDVAYAHLAAFSDEGYRYGASYLLDWRTMEHLRDHTALVNWGGGRGVSDDDSGGLAWYKRGWATSTVTCYVLGAVLDRSAYAFLSNSGSRTNVTYFPRYRAGEFR